MGDIIGAYKSITTKMANKEGDIRLLYYHPDLDPNEKGKTWRIINMPLGDDTPRTEGLLDDVEFSIN